MSKDDQHKRTGVPGLGLAPARPGMMFAVMNIPFSVFTARRVVPPRNELLITSPFKTFSSFRGVVDGGYT